MWPEVEKAKAENRHELVLSGGAVSKRLKDGLDLSIFDLNSLNFLDIHDTDLVQVPDQVSKLNQLQSLVLHSNKLETFNANITKLEKLKLLDLSRNQLKQLPAEIDNLTSVVTLNFSNNLLVEFPTLGKTHKLAVLCLSNNKLKSFPNVCSPALANLSELKLGDNEIELVPADIKNLTSLKTLELANNKIATVPGELALCAKLKVVDLKSNPISDRRLLKLIDQCRTKQILDYVKAHSKCAQPVENNKKDSALETKEQVFRYIIKVRSEDSAKIIVDESVKSVREFLVACKVTNLAFTEESFKKFIQIQNKLHDTVCSKRNAATIATHDYSKLPDGDLEYTTLAPTELQIHPLNRTNTMSGEELFAKLQAEANNLRKEKKRNTYSGIHKYLSLIEGCARYPCLLNSQKVVISFPPITNSEVSKIHVGTTAMLVEVTSSVSLHCAKVAIEALLKELLGLQKELDVVPVRTTDQQGNLKVMFPSKTDLKFEGGDVKVITV